MYGMKWWERNRKSPLQCQFVPVRQVKVLILPIQIRTVSV